MEHNRNTILNDDRLLTEFIVDVLKAPDSPWVVQWVSEDAARLVLCQSIANAGSGEDPEFKQRLARACRGKGVLQEHLIFLLQPVARGLGLISAEGQCNFYDLLDLDTSAGQDKIQTAYRLKARQLHPDMHPDKENGSEDFIQLQNAYKTLKDPELRRHYDLSCQNFGLWREATAANQTQHHAKTPSWKNLYLQLAVVAVMLIAITFIAESLFQKKALTEDKYAVKNQSSENPDKHPNTTLLQEIATPVSARANSTPIQKDDDIEQPPSQPSPIYPPEKPSARSDIFSSNPTVMEHRADRRRANPKDTLPSNGPDHSSGIPAVEKSKINSAVTRLNKSNLQATTREIFHNPIDLELQTPATESDLEISVALEKTIHRDEPVAPNPEFISKGTAELLQTFVQTYCIKYESRNLDEFKQLFTPNAIENGKSFKSLNATYRNTFNRMEHIEYHIKIRNYTVDMASGDIRMKGAVNLKWQDRRSGKTKISKGQLEMDLIPGTQWGFLVKKLSYNFKKS